MWKIDQEEFQELCRNAGVDYKLFFNREDVCKLKGLNYNTASKFVLWPDNEKRLGGRRVYPIRDVMDWLTKTDEEESG